MNALLEYLVFLILQLSVQYNFLNYYATETEIWYYVHMIVCMRVNYMYMRMHAM